MITRYRDCTAEPIEPGRRIVTMTHSRQLAAAYSGAEDTAPAGPRPTGQPALSGSCAALRNWQPVMMELINYRRVTRVCVDSTLSQCADKATHGVHSGFLYGVLSHPKLVSTALRRRQ